MTAEEIAAGLSEAQKRALRFERFPPSVAQKREHRTYAALQARGVLEFRHIIAGRGDFTLTPLGQQVRAILESNHDRA